MGALPSMLQAVDVHVHVASPDPRHGRMSPALLAQPTFHLMKWMFGIDPHLPRAAGEIRDLLYSSVESTPELDVAVVCALDRVYGLDGEPQREDTHLWVENDYAREVAAGSKRLRWACSVHPFRPDAIAELDRCLGLGAVMVKWLPVSQGFCPDHPHCTAFLEALAKRGVTLLSHTGAEHAIPVLEPKAASPACLELALKIGVKVIAAHCGTPLLPWEADGVGEFIRLVHLYPNLWGDTAAACLPFRWKGFARVMADPVARERLVHGSDWPILPVPPTFDVLCEHGGDLLSEGNLFRRDILIKQKLGLAGEYWARGRSFFAGG